MQKIASAGTKEALTKLINEYYYSTTYRIGENNTVWNSKGLFAPGIVKEKNNRFYYYIKF